MSGVVRVYVVVLAIVLMSGVASATTHTVCASGCDYTTIQAAENVAVAGDTVYVYNGTYTENVDITTAHLTLEGEGRDVVTVTAATTDDHVFDVTANYINISGLTMTGATDANKAGININFGCDNTNISYNNLSGNRHGIYGLYSDNNLISYNTIQNCLYNSGILFIGSINNDVLHNEFFNNYYGISLGSNSNYGNIYNNTMSVGHYGFYIVDSGNFVLDNNTIKNTNIPLYQSNSPNTSITSQSSINNLIATSSFTADSREIGIGGKTNFSLVLKNVSGVDCPSCTYIIDLYPSEVNLQYSKSGNVVTGNFTPLKQGIYSLKITTNDGDNNTEIRMYKYLVNVSTFNVVDYFFRGVRATHRQVVSYGTAHDAGSFLSSPPLSAESIYCVQYVGLSIDELNEQYTTIVKYVNCSIYYETTAAGHIGMQQYGNGTTAVDISTNVPATTGKEFGIFNLSLDFVTDYPYAYYWYSIKLVGSAVYIHSTPSQSSYANITYAYSTTPAIKAISNEDIRLLSATSPAADDTSASIILDGEGATNLSVQMPNTALTYTATYDGSPCNDAACSFTQSNGELNFSLTLGSEHTIEITEEDGDNSTYATHLTATTPGTAANTITTTTTCANASFGAATLTGGSDSDSEWAGSDVPTGVDIWRDGAGMIAIVVLALLAGIVIVCLRGGGIGEGLTISPNAAIGLAVGLLVLLAVFSIAPIFGDKIDSVADLGQETYATGRLTFVLDGTTADGETVTIDATTLEFDRSADGVTAGRIAVNISDSTAAIASQNLTAAINGNATLAAVVVARRDVST